VLPVIEEPWRRSVPCPIQITPVRHRTAPRRRLTTTTEKITPRHQGRFAEDDPRSTLVMENPAMALVVRLRHRDDEHELPVPPEQPAHEELTRFLNRQGPYAQVWIRLASGEYVRYDDIVSVRIQE
jgi:hypothetical protein